MRIRPPRHLFITKKPRHYHLGNAKRMYIRDDGKFVAIGWRVHYQLRWDAPKNLPAYTVKAFLDSDLKV